MVHIKLKQIFSRTYIIIGKITIILFIYLYTVYVIINY